MTKSLLETALDKALMTATPGEHWDHILRRADNYLRFMLPTEKAPVDSTVAGGPLNWDSLTRTVVGGGVGKY